MSRPTDSVGTSPGSTTCPRHIWWAIFTDHPNCRSSKNVAYPESPDGFPADMERYTRHWRFDESIINAERIEAGNPCRWSWFSSTTTPVRVARLTTPMGGSDDP